LHVKAMPSDSLVLSAILVTAAGSVRSATDHVCRDRPFGPGVRCRQRDDDEVHVDLDEVPVDVDRVRVVLDAGGTPLGQFTAPTMRVAEEFGDLVAYYPVAGLDGERAVVAVEFYRWEGGWRLRAVGQGYVGGLPELATSHGFTLPVPDIDAADIDHWVLDPRNLLSTAPESVLLTVGRVSSPQARAAVNGYRHALPRLRACLDRERPAYLQLAARCLGAPELADAVTASGLPLAFVTDWASWIPRVARRTLPGSLDDVRSVAVGQYPFGAVIAAVADPDGDPAVRLWNGITGEGIWVTSILYSMPRNAGPPNAVTFAMVYDHLDIVTGGNGGKVAAWDPFTGRILGHYTGLTGDVLAVAAGRMVARDVIAAGKEGDARWANAARRPDDDRAVIAAATADGTIRIWDAAMKAKIGGPLTGPAGPLRSLAFGRVDGRTVVVSGGADGTVWRWDAATGEPIGSPLAGHTGQVTAVAWGTTDDRSLIVSGGADRTVRTCDAATGEPIGPPLTAHTAEVRFVGCGHVDGRAVIVSGDAGGTVWTRDAATGRPAGRALRLKPVTAGTFAEIDGVPTIVTATRRVVCWDLTAGDPPEPVAPVHSGQVMAVAIADIDGRTVVATGDADAAIRLWDATTGEVIGRPLTGHTGRIAWMAFAPTPAAASAAGEAARLVTVGSDQTSRQWNITTGTQIGDPGEGWRGTRAFGDVDGRPAWAMSRDDHSVSVVDSATGKPIHDGLVRTKRVHSIAFGRVGERTMIATGSCDGTVRRWDAATGTPIGDPLVAHTDCVRSMAFGSLKGRNGAFPVLVTASKDHTIRLLDPQTGSAPGTEDAFDGHGTTMPDRIDLGAPIHAVACHVDVENPGPLRIIAGTGSGVVSLRLPPPDDPPSAPRDRSA
jgi:WD40 repeat protein